jgi:hypothetical protein
MKTRLYITSFLTALLTLGILQGCGVDPLETTDKFGTTMCEKKDMPDTDGDGLNDECEKLLGSDPNKKDSDNDGIEDDKDPPLNPNPPPAGYDCSDSSYASETEQYYCELDGLRRNNLNEEQRSATLANSALNAKAPAGTVVSVTEQLIRIVHNGAGLGGTNSALTTLCKGKDKAPLTSYIYYKVVGTVGYCQLGDDTNGRCEPTPIETQLELCGPLVHGSLANPSSGQDLVFDKFEWTAGKTLNGRFTPNSMLKNQTSILTLTPSDLENVGPGIFEKLKVNFKDAFPIDGRFTRNYKVDGEEPVKDTTYVTTDEPTEVMRNFKRSSVDQGTQSDEDFANLYPKMLGPWRAE